MRRARRLLADVADAVANGEPIDWDRVRLRLRGSGEEHRADALASLADRVPSSSGRLLHEAASRPPGGSWLAALALAFGALEISVAPLGLLHAAPGDASSVTRLFAATALALLAAAAVLVLGGRDDERAGSLAGVFVAIGGSCAQPPLGALAGSGSKLGAALGLIGSAETALPFFLWSFARDFPRLVRFSRFTAWAGRMRTLSALLGGGLFLADCDILGDALGRSGDAYWLLLYGASAPALLVVWLRGREAAPNERRRVGLFLSVIALPIGAITLEVLLEILLPGFKSLMDDAAVRSASRYVLFPALVGVAASTTYTVLAHQVLDVRDLLDALLRRVAAGAELYALAGLSLAASIAYVAARSREPVIEVVASGSGPLLFPVTGLLLGLLVLRPVFARVRERILERDMEQWLETLSSFTRRLEHVEGAVELAAALQEELRRSLGDAGTRLLLPDPAGDWLLPAGGELRPLRRDSCLATVLFAEVTPLSTDSRDPGSVFAVLPEEERQWVADANLACLLPITGRAGRVLGAMGLSLRLERAPYSASELMLSGALAGATSARLERGDLRDMPAREQADPVEAASECGSCGRVVAASRTSCECGQPLRPAPIPLLVAGKFRVRRMLGHGGMGVVYAAQDVTLEREVALKTLPRVSAEASIRLRREARSMASLTHPHIAVLYGYESWRGTPILVVEYLGGGTLRERLGRALPPGQVLAWGAKVAEALAALHARGLLHRDVKPSNIGFDLSGQPKLLDFGLTRLVHELTVEPAALPSIAESRRGDLTRHSRVMGTPVYMSPEAVRGAWPAPAHDLWGLFVSLWEAIAGRHPYGQADSARAQRRLEAGRVPDVRELRPDCPEAVALLLARGLAREPADRFDSAALVAAELSRLAEERPLPPGAPHPPPDHAPTPPPY